MTRVRWDHLSPQALTSRLEARPVAYLPLGTLEWHGPHLPLGVDAMISEELLTRCARRHGGVVLPPIHLGPDRSKTGDDGEMLIGMDYDETTRPAQKLPGNAYFVDEETFERIVLGLLSQLKRAGVAGVFADGHGPSRWSWAAHLDSWGRQTGLRLVGVTPEREKTWKSQIDHAARNETSLMLAARPELVDLTQAQGELLGVAGEHPQDATAEEGEHILEEAVEHIQRWLLDAGL